MRRNVGLESKRLFIVMLYLVDAVWWNNFTRIETVVTGKRAYHLLKGSLFIAVGILANEAWKRVKRVAEKRVVHEAIKTFEAGWSVWYERGCSVCISAAVLPLLMPQVEVRDITVLIDNTGQSVGRCTRNGAFVVLSFERTQYFDARSGGRQSQLSANTEVPTVNCFTDSDRSCYWRHITDCLREHRWGSRMSGAVRSSVIRKFMCRSALSKAGRRRMRLWNRACRPYERCSTDRYWRSLVVVQQNE